MKKIHFVINDQAEVGKSAFSAALHSFLRDQGYQSGFLAIVGEGNLVDDIGYPYDGSWNLLEDNDLSTLFEWSERFEVLVCDVHSGNAEFLLELIANSDLFLDLSDLDTEVTVITPDVEEASCHEEIAVIAEALSDRVYYVVPRVPVAEFSSSLEAWEDSEASKIMDYLGAVVMEVPRITDAIQDLLEDHEIELLEAMSLPSHELPRLVAKAISTWRREFDHQLEEALEFLLPATTKRYVCSKAKLSA